MHFGELTIERLRGFDRVYGNELISPRPNANFVILLPGQTYVKEITELIPLIEATDDPTASKDDEYTIEIEMSTWINWYSGLTDLLQRKWKGIGFLWTKPIWSEPMRFTMGRKRRNIAKNEQ